MGKINDILSTLKTTLEGITIERGYEFDIGSIDNQQQEHCVYPSVDLDFDSEETIFVGDTLESFNHAELNLQMTVRCKLDETTANPQKAYRDECAKVLKGIKTCIYKINGEIGVEQGFKELYGQMFYRGMTRENERSNDAFTPGKMILNWAIRYQEDVTLTGE